jgi:Domain of unknown function (DUF6456)
MSERTRPAITVRARSKKKQSVPIEYRALPTPERMRRAGNDYIRGDTGQITLGDNPLDRSFSRGVINQEQYSAAQKFRHHWYHAGLADRLMSLDLDRVFAVDVSGFSGMPKSEGQAFHRQRYREAVQLVGKIGSHVLDSAVCREIGFEQIGYSLGWGSRAQAYAAAVERMKAALDQLWELWGIG